MLLARPANAGVKLDFVGDGECRIGENSDALKVQRTGRLYFTGAEGKGGTRRGVPTGFKLLVEKENAGDIIEAPVLRACYAQLLRELLARFIKIADRNEGGREVL